MLAPACAILEAILFASGDPIPFSRLAAASGIPERELPQLLNDLNTAYQKSGHALNQNLSDFCPPDSRQESRSIRPRIPFS